MKPLLILDLETTGVDVATDRIIEFAAVKLDWETFDEIDRKEFMVNPGKAIPKESSDIHGIKYDDIKDKPKFKDVAKDLAKWMEGCDIGGYNIIRFDIPLLLCEFERVGVKFSLEGCAFVDGYEIFVHFHPRTLAGAYEHYVGGKIKDAHQAMGDVLTTQEVLARQLSEHDELRVATHALDASKVVRDENIIDLQAKLIWKDDAVAVNFGKHKGQSLKAVPKPYINWMLKNKVVVDPKGIFLLKSALEGRFAKKGG